MFKITFPHPWAVRVGWLGPEEGGETQVQAPAGARGPDIASGDGVQIHANTGISRHHDRSQCSEGQRTQISWKPLSSWCPPPLLSTPGSTRGLSQVTESFLMVKTPRVFSDTKLHINFPVQALLDLSFHKAFLVFLSLEFFPLSFFTQASFLSSLQSQGGQTFFREFLNALCKWLLL